MCRRIAAAAEKYNHQLLTPTGHRHQGAWRINLGKDFTPVELCYRFYLKVP